MAVLGLGVAVVLVVAWHMSEPEIELERVVLASVAAHVRVALAAPVPVGVAAPVPVGVAAPVPVPV